MRGVYRARGHMGGGVCSTPRAASPRPGSPCADLADVDSAISPGGERPPGPPRRCAPLCGPQTTAERDRAVQGGAREMKKGGSVLCRAQAVQYAWMKRPRAPLTVSARCRALAGARRGASEWRTRPPRPPAQAEPGLSARMGPPVAAHRHGYGTRRRTVGVAQAGTHGSRRRLGRLRAAQARQGKPRRPCQPTTDARHGQAVAPPGRQRPCDSAQPETAAVGDLPDRWPAEGWWSLAVVSDGCSRAGVGGSRHRGRPAARVTKA